MIYTLEADLARGETEIGIGLSQAGCEQCFVTLYTYIYTDLKYTEIRQEIGQKWAGIRQEKDSVPTNLRYACHLT
jgi:hypothetical protein